MIQAVYDLLGLLFGVIMVGSGVVAAAVVFSGMFVKLVGWRI